MTIIVNSKSEAWSFVENFLKETKAYCYKNEEASISAGYEIYFIKKPGDLYINEYIRSIVMKNGDMFISGCIVDLGDRLELSYGNREPINIRIKEPTKKENKSDFSLEELLLLSYALQRVIVEDGSNNKKEELSRKLLGMACEKTKK